VAVINCGTMGPVSVFYLGTNDCGRTPSDELEQIVETIFDTLHDLYVTAGARNFVLIDVPPIDRSPGGNGDLSRLPLVASDIIHPAVESDSAEDIKERVETWNELLRSQAKDFAEGSEKATIFVFSSHRVLTEVLDEPLDFDFVEEDPETEGGNIWTDDLHLTPAVHAILAERLLDSLTK
jgi:lysophospholipase L1-like esterase